MPVLHPQPFKVNKAASHSGEPGVLSTDICEILLGTKPRRHLYRLIAEVKPAVHSDTGWQSRRGSRAGSKVSGGLQDSWAILKTNMVWVLFTAKKEMFSSQTLNKHSKTASDIYNSY